MVRLSRQQQKVYDLLIQGLMGKQIAIELGLNPKTISTHKARIKEKLKVGSDYEIFKLALQPKPKSAPDKKNVWLWTEVKVKRRTTRR
jgi:DNA-binding NarL/FixJ family response regulator